MKNLILFVIAALICFSFTGCSICCGPFDYDYPDFGGKHERQDRRHGRVGSIFSDPLAPRAGGASADSNLQAPPPLTSLEPQEPDDSDLEGDLDDPDDIDDLERDLEDIDPLDLDGEELPSLDEIDEDTDLRTPVNKKTRLIRNRPLR